MPASKIRFEEDDFKFINGYKEATGVSLQRFVTVAIQELRARLEAEQFIKDEPYTKKDATIPR